MPVSLTVLTYISIAISLFLADRSFRRFRRSRTYRTVLLDSEKNGVLLIAANGNVRRSALRLTLASLSLLTLVAVLLVDNFGPQPKHLPDPTPWRALLLLVAILIPLVITTLTGIRDDQDIARSLAYGIDDSGQQLARQDTLIEVQADVAAVSEKVGAAADAAVDAAAEANKVNQKIATLTKRADVSEERADDAEAREHE